MREVAETRSRLLVWYDENARDLPWRVPPGSNRRPDPYRVWLSEVMLQQTTVVVGGRYFLRFVERWPTVKHLAAEDDDQVMAAWAGLGYYARARNLLKCARAVAKDGFPDTEDGLRALPGIGPYTAAAIAAIAFDRPATVVDGNVERVVARLFAVRTPLPDAKPRLRALAETLTPSDRPGDFAQAMMDLGATVCTPRSPRCGGCPLRTFCRARADGVAADLPLRTPKSPKPVRQGTVFLARRDDGAWLLERRPGRGLLGGMLGWPGNEWAEEPSSPAAPLIADWRQVAGEVRHTFTHFHLRLAVRRADVTRSVNPAVGEFVPPAKFSPDALPTVMRKAFLLGRDC